MGKFRSSRQTSIQIPFYGESGARQAIGTYCRAGRCPSGYVFLCAQARLLISSYPVEPIVNGTVTGPALSGTLTGGVAFPVFRDGMKIEEPDIVVYGETKAKGSIFATIEGVGNSTEQWTRVVSLSSTFFIFLRLGV